MLVYKNKLFFEINTFYGLVKKKKFTSLRVTRQLAGDSEGGKFNEVQRSNMSKACKSLEEAERTVAHYKGRIGSY